MSDWDFYEGRMDDDRAFIAIDLSVIRAAPVRSHPVRLQIRIAMRNPRPDGLRSAEEADALFAAEDRVTEAMSSRAGAMFVARVVARGYTELFFYVPAAHRLDVDDPPALVGDLAPYALEWLVEDDEEWTTYQDLFPNRYAMQSIQNRRLVSEMIEVGDRVEVAREVDHLATFPSEEAARTASTALAALDYRVDAPEEQDGRWSLQFHRVDTCDGGRPDEFVFEILDVLDPLDGEYDGWGSAIIRD